MKGFQRSIKNNFFISLIFLMIIGSFLRLYRIEELMTYLGDEGRDMLIVLDIVRGKHFPLLGPPTSVGEGLYLGPIFYYFIAPFAFIFKMNPVGPAIFVAIIGILTIPLLYIVVKKIFSSEYIALLSALFYTISPLTIQFSRSSWNPNPMPFFALLLIWSLILFQETKKNIYLYLSAVFLSTMLQLHYIIIFILPFILLIYLYFFKNVKHRKSLLIFLLIILLFSSPLIIFDLRHNFINLKGFLEIFRTRSIQGFNSFDILSRSRDRFRQLFSLFYGFSEREWQTNFLVIASSVVIILDFIKSKIFKKGLLYGWFAWGLLSIGFYRQSFYPHYLGFLSPFPAIFVALALYKIFEWRKIFVIISVPLIVVLSFYMMQTTWKFLSRPSAINVKLVQKIVLIIKNESNNQPFNFALLAENNYDDSYRYYFKLWNIPATYQTEVAKQLFVACEEVACNPEGNPKWEIALFDAAYNGNIKLTGTWIIDNKVKIYKFIPNQLIKIS